MYSANIYLYLISALLSHPYFPPSNSMMGLVENTLIKSPLTPLCSQGIFETDFAVNTGLMRCSESYHTLVLSKVRGGQSVRKPSWENTQREKEELELFLCRVSCLLCSMFQAEIAQNGKRWKLKKIQKGSTWLSSWNDLKVAKSQLSGNINM